MNTKSSSPPVSSVPDGSRPPPPSAAAQASSLASPSRDRALTRRLVVSRLLVLDEAKSLETVHVRIAAAAASVAPRTVWRWLAIARESGRAEPARRLSFTVTDALWARLSDLGGNVKALHDWMREHPHEALPSPTANTLPSLTTLYRAVQQEQRAGRVLEISRPAHARRDPDRYDRALAELALPGTVDETGRITLPLPSELTPAVAETGPAATRPSPFANGARLHVPGAHTVSTRQLGAVAEALAHTVAARGIVCVYGDPGHGKTIALHQALRLLPRRVPVHRALVAVKPALPQLRAALLTAFGLPAISLTNRTDAADRALLDALAPPGVLVIDDVQRVAAPELDYLRLLADAPTTHTSLVLCGAGAERTLARAPALASRVLTWQHVPRLDASQVPGVLRLFHPLWDGATDEDLLHIDTTHARGNFRTWAKITSHAYAARSRDPDTAVDRTLLTWACSRLGPKP